MSENILEKSKRNAAGSCKNAPSENSKKMETLESARKKIQSKLARLALFVIAIVIIALLVNVFAGGEPGVTLALLFCLIVVPCIFYGFKLYVDHTAKKKK